MKLLLSVLLIGTSAFAEGYSKKFKCEGSNSYGTAKVYTSAKSINHLSRPAVFITSKSTGKTWLSYGASEIQGAAVNDLLNSYVVSGNDDDHYSLIIPKDLSNENFNGLLQRVFHGKIIDETIVLCEISNPN